MAEQHSLETVDPAAPLVAERAKYERQTIVFTTLHGGWGSTAEGVWIAPRQARIKAARFCASTNLGPNGAAYGRVGVSVGGPNGDEAADPGMVCYARHQTVAFGDLTTGTTSAMMLGLNTVIEANESLQFTTQIEAGAPGALGQCMVVLDFIWT